MTPDVFDRSSVSGPSSLQVRAVIAFVNACSARALHLALLVRNEWHPLTHHGWRPTHVNEVDVGDAAGNV